MRCPDCNKFVSLEMADPDVQATLSGRSVSVETSISRTCAECSQELKTGNFSTDLDFEDAIEKHYKESKGCANKDDLEVEVQDVEPVEEGGGRYAKSYYGFSATVIVKCNTCEEEITSQGVSDKMAASHMDESV